MASRRTSTNKILFETDGLAITNSKLIPGEIGVISKRNYKKGELLFLVKGSVRNTPTRYSFSVGKDQHIEPTGNNEEGNFGHYINHSCDPNSLVRIVLKDSQNPYIEIVARENIKKGDELTFDYGTLEYETTIDGSKCKCGAIICRGKIHGFRYLPKDVIDAYIKEGIISDYLLNLRQSEDRLN